MKLREALQALYDEQNGAPLIRRYEQWAHAMELARAALAEPVADEPVAWLVTRLRRKGDESSGRVRYLHPTEQLAMDDYAGWADIPGALPTIEPLYTHPAAVNQELLEALEMAVRQNEHDMLMTGEELRQCSAAIARAKGE